MCIRKTLRAECQNVRLTMAKYTNCQLQTTEIFEMLLKGLFYYRMKYGNQISNFFAIY